MSTSSLAYEVRRAQGVARLRDLADLARPRIAALVLVTVTVGAFAAGWGPPGALLLVHTLLGTLLVAGSAGAMNQWLERHTDALMARTADRPLPAGRLSAAEVLLGGLAGVALGLAYLALAVNLWTAALGLVTWLFYVALYTPLKRRTTANTAVGAVAGALPVLMGWSATGARLDLHAATLFLIVYLWQFPHFMAIAWIYRRQYAAAGLKMLPVVDPSGRRAGRCALLSASLLVPVSLVPVLNPAGPLYLALALLLGLGQWSLAARFARRLDDRSARALLRASLVYLPALMVLLMLVPLI